MYTMKQKNDISHFMQRTIYGEVKPLKSQSKMVSDMISTKTQFISKNIISYYVPNIGYVVFRSISHRAYIQV